MEGEGGLGKGQEMGGLCLGVLEVGAEALLGEVDLVDGLWEACTYEIHNGWGMRKGPPNGKHTWRVHLVVHS